MKIVATTSLPAVDRPNADRWNAARSHQKIEYEKIYGEDVRTIRKVLKLFQNNFEKRDQHLKQTDDPRIPERLDPLYNDLYSNGNKLID